MSEQLQLYEIVVMEFVGDGVALEDKTYLVTMTMVGSSGELCLFGANKLPIAMIAPGYWTNVRYRPLEKGEMQ